MRHRLAKEVKKKKKKKKETETMSFRKAAEMQPIVTEFLSFSSPIPVFSISSQNPTKLFQSLSAINSFI
jgi:hypothetical protein